MKRKKQISKVVLPKGVFCNKNCNTCRNPDWRDTKEDGRVYCGVGHGYNHPRDREGCFDWVSKN